MQPPFNNSYRIQVSNFTQTAYCRGGKNGVGLIAIILRIFKSTQFLRSFERFKIYATTAKFDVIYAKGHLQYNNKIAETAAHHITK
jgi:hypothetical protein